MAWLYNHMCDRAATVAYFPVSDTDTESAAIEWSSERHSFSYTALHDSFAATALH